jgi:RNA polymerase sigma factor (sigma-70 family)
LERDEPETVLDLNELQDAAKKGDHRAEKELFGVLSVRFHLFAYHKVWDEESAQEIAQDALAVVAREYRGLEVRTSFAAWAHQVLEYRILAYIKAKRVRDQRFADDTEQGASGAPDPVLKMKLAKCLGLVGRANRRYARILNLHYQGFSTEEICERLGVSVSNCYVLLSRARAMLEQCLEKGRSEL